MAGSQYNVEAKLTLDTMKARRDALRLQRDIINVGKQITKMETASGKATDKLTKGLRQARPEVARTSGALGGLMRNLLGMGAAYVALRSVIGGMKALADGALEYNVELERTKIGLTAIFQALSNGQQSWSQAANTSDQVFKDLQADAIKSVATTQELFGVYQAIVGPIMAAGAGMDVVRKLTNDTVAASSVLNVDLAQAQRDIGMMVRGTAGMDVKLFSVLKSTGAIAENAEQWNKNLSAGQRIAKLQTALGKFAPAGERFGKSWAGVTSTFKDIRQQFTQSAMKPVIDTMGRSLDRVNTYLINNQDRIRAKLTAWGENFATKIDSAFSRAAKSAQWLTENWDSVINRMGVAMAEAKNIAKALAVGYGTAAVGRAAGGMMLGTAAVAATEGAAGTAATAGVVATIGGVPATVVALTAAIVGLGAAAAVAEQKVLYGKTAGNLGQGATGLAGDWAGLVTNVGKMGIGAGTSVLGDTAETASNFTFMARAMTKGASAAALWTASALNFLSGGEEGRRLAAEGTEKYTKQMANAWEGAATAASISAEQLLRKMQSFIPAGEETALKELGAQFGTDAEQYARYLARGATPTGAPGGRTQTNIDMRGSKINVKQEFKSADPDRVLIDMVNALSQQAEMRIQSGYAPALGRG